MTHTASTPARSTLSFAVAIFTGAFLLFLVQPLIGKYILPWFGGSPGVWTTCLLFFQCVLLAGYAYAHLLTTFLKPRQQVITHLAVVAIALATLPIIPSDQLKPAGDGDPILQILLVLSRTIGLPYLALSATGPLMQAWFSRAHPGQSPYRLYALSNIGSLLALLAYPVLVETSLSRPAQARWWSFGMVAFAAAACWCARELWSAPIDEQKSDAAATDKSDEEVKVPGRAFLWLALPACATAVLMAATNKICQDVAVVPFLWVLPLALYLITFIIAFDSPRWYSRAWYGRALILCWAAVTWAMFKGVDVSIAKQLLIYSATLFVTCMVCHGELYQLRPAPRRLTAYFLTISAGGALGGLFVALLAPMVFNSYMEFNIGLFASGLLFTLVCLLRKSIWLIGRWQVAIACTMSWTAACWAIFRYTEVSIAAQIGLGATALVVAAVVSHFLPRWIGAPEKPSLPFQIAVGTVGALASLLAALVLLLVTRSYEEYRLAIWGGAALLAVICYIWISVGPATRWNVPVWIPLLPVIGALGWGLWSQAKDANEGALSSSRNFYGVLAVMEYYPDNPEEHYRLLRHGRITHGFQYVDPIHARRQTSYYGGKSGVGLAIRHTRAKNKRVGVVGLGTGTIATYGREGDVYRFYDINPEVIRLAGPEGDTFTYLKNSDAKIEVALGDARLSMEREAREAPQQFDVIALDAFSSDAIPVHLVTKESFDIYKHHLATNGVIAVHTSNRYLNLEPVVLKLAKHLDMKALIINGKEEDESWVYGSTWILLTNNPAILDNDEVKAALSAPSKGGDDVPLWTDDYASIFAILEDNPFDEMSEWLKNLFAKKAAVTTD